MFLVLNFNNYSSLSDFLRLKMVYGNPFVSRPDSFGVDWGNKGRPVWYNKGRSTRRRNFSRFTGARRRPTSYPRISRVPRPELKFHDTAFSAVATVLGSNATMHPLNLIAQGLTSSTRNGMRFTIKSIQLSLTISVAQFVGVTNSLIIRAMLMVDSQSNGAVPVELDVLETTDDVNGLRNPQHAHRFRMLMDRKYVLNAPSITWNGSAEVSQQFHSKISLYKKLNVPIFYEATTAAITGVTQNNLVLFIYADSTTPNGFLNGCARIRYYDV